MKAFLLEDREKSSFIDVQKQEPLSGEIVVKVKTLGLCGSDFKTYHKENPMVVYPIIPGHEIGCEIVALGPDVPSAIKVGQRGTILPYTTCGHCPACRAKKFNTCSTNKTMGVARPGAAQPYVKLRYQDFIACPDEMSFTDIALIEPLSVGIHAARRAKDVKGKKVLLYGLGIVGLGVLLELVKAGADVSLADIAEDKLKLALEMGANKAFNIKSATFRKEVEEYTNNEGFEVVLDAVGSASVAQSALELVAVAGTIVFIGYHDDTFPFTTKPIVSRELSVFGSRNALLEDFVAAKEIILEKPDLKETLISKRFLFEDIDKAFRYWTENRKSVTKILIDFK
jgi:threonine dehydrogenase-like Zn-dependent dehydrogenase